MTETHEMPPPGTPQGMSREALEAIGKFMTLMFRENGITAAVGMEFEFSMKISPTPGGNFLMTDLRLTEAISSVILRS